jgi:hypothetical protein
MMDYDIPSELQWKEIVRLGKTKCNFPCPSKLPSSCQQSMGPDIIQSD